MPDDTTPDPRDVCNTRHYPQPPAAVFAALADPARLARWWGPAGFSNRFAVCDVRPGGDWRHTMVGPDGTEYPNEARFLRVAPPPTATPSPSSCTAPTSRTWTGWPTSWRGSPEKL